jgi:hypothetical protein
MRRSGGNATLYRPDGKDGHQSGQKVRANNFGEGYGTTARASASILEFQPFNGEAP